MTESETRYTSAVAAQKAAEQKAGSTPRTDVEARAAAVLEVKQAADAVREAKDAVKVDNVRRNFAGINSPLHAACVERVPGIVAELEQRAIEIQADRDRVAAERRAAKEAPPLVPAVFPGVAKEHGEVEVIIRRGAR